MTATSSIRREKQPEQEIAISVVVPVRDGGRTVGQCILALTSSGYPNYEIIVVDDCSSDDTPRLVQQSGVRYVRTRKRLGPAGARNLGARYACGEILVFIDADVVLPQEGLFLIAEHFASHPNVSAMFGLYDDQPASKTFVSQFKNLMHHYVHQSSSEVASTFWAGCGAIRKSAFLDLGGFDEVTYTTPSIEDIALGFRLIEQGHQIRLDKRLQAKHLKHWTIPGLLRSDIFARAVPWTKLILSSGHVPRALNLSYSARISSALVGLLAILFAVMPFAVHAASLRAFVSLVPVAVAISLALLLINANLYLFFRRKRGLWFAAGSVLAHWAYCLYSGITFASVALTNAAGSKWSHHKLETVRVEMNEVKVRVEESRTTGGRVLPNELRRPRTAGPGECVPPSVLGMLAPLHRTALGIACGLVSGGFLAIATLRLILHTDVNFDLDLLSQFFWGYRVAPSGILIGLFWGFAAGFIFGFAFATARNLAVWIWITANRSRAEIQEYSDFLDRL